MLYPFLKMMKCRGSITAALAGLALVAPLAGCSDEGPDYGTMTGATTGSGGPTTGSLSSGAVTTGSASSGGLATSSASSGGFGTGMTGSATSGGMTTGSTGMGGASTGGGSTAGSTTGGNTIPPTFETLKYVISAVPCFGAGCHNDPVNPLDLQLTDQLYTNLTTRISESCGNIPVVTPLDPEQSALVMLLKGPCGEVGRMPFGCVENEFEDSCLPDEYIAAIEQWVADGAPEQ